MPTPGTPAGPGDGGTSPDAGLVRAAGGIVLRRAAPGRWEVAVVHRPVRGDWSLPKGKLEPGERLQETAVREVLEETGLRCRLGPFVGRTEYRDTKDRPKVVAYWAMAPVAGTFRPSREVDELRWVDLEAAAELLTYHRDRDLVAVVSAMLPGAAPPA